MKGAHITQDFYTPSTKISYKQKQHSKYSNIYSKYYKNGSQMKIKYSGSQIKSMSTLPTKNTIDYNPLSHSQIGSIKNIRNQSLKLEDKPISFEVIPSSQKRSKQRTNNLKKFMQVKNRNYPIYHSSQKLSSNRKLLLDSYIKQGKKDKDSLSRQQIHLLTSQRKDLSELQRQNFQLRSRILDLQLKQRDYVQKINQLQKLCAKLGDCLSKITVVSKVQRKYLDVVKDSFQSCFGIKDYSQIWKKQKQILSQWYGNNAKKYQEQNKNEINDVQKFKYKLNKGKKFLTQNPQLDYQIRIKKFEDTQNKNNKKHQSMEDKQRSGFKKIKIKKMQSSSSDYEDNCQKYSDNSCKICKVNKQMQIRNQNELIQ